LAKKKKKKRLAKISHFETFWVNMDRGQILDEPMNEPMDAIPFHVTRSIPRFYSTLLINLCSAVQWFDANHRIFISFISAENRILTKGVVCTSPCFLELLKKLLKSR
jgi:hypothetical protein